MRLLLKSSIFAILNRYKHNYKIKNMQHYINQIRQHATIQNGTLLLALIIAAAWMFGTMDTLQKNFAYQREVDTKRQELELDKLRNQNLEYQQRYLRSDEYLELSAREYLGKTSPGETLVVLPDSSKIVDEVDAPAQRAEVKPSNFSQWVRFLSGRNDGS